jgi:hypothetical protein
VDLTLLVRGNFQVPKWQAETIFRGASKSVNISQIVIIDENSVSNSSIAAKFRSLFTTLLNRNSHQINLLDVFPKVPPIKKIDLSVNQDSLNSDTVDFNFLKSDSILLNLSNLQISSTSLKIKAMLSLKLERVEVQNGAELFKQKNQNGIELVRAQTVLYVPHSDVVTPTIFEGYSRVHGYSQSKSFREATGMSAEVFRKSLEAISDLNSCLSKEFRSWEIIASKEKLSDSRVKRTINALKKLTYGIFYEKRWKVAFLHKELEFTKENLFNSSELMLVDLPDKYFGAADPCGIFEEFIYCELLSLKSGKGVLGRWGNNKWELIDFPFKGHISYPQIIHSNEGRYLFPEVSKWSSPALFELNSEGYPIGGPITLKGLTDIRALDGTLFEHQGVWYLFAGVYPTSHERLNLYFSTSLFGEFIEHPQSPIVLDPRYSRMGGQIVLKGTELFRFSQDCSEKYGSMMNIFSIREIGTTKYDEVKVGSIKFSDAFGPHAISKHADSYYIDFYTENFSFGAGYRRFKAKFF